VKARPLGTSTAPAWTPLDEASRTPPARSAPAVQYARILERAADGVVTRLILPGRTAGNSVPYSIRTADGSAMRMGSITADGLLRPDPAMRSFANLEPNTTLVATTTPDGRVLGVVALLPQSAPRTPGEVARRDRAGATPARSSDLDEHNPHEVFISGHVGSIVSVK
jgi:hypothetical protein